MKASWEEVTATHTVETGAATWISKKAGHVTEEVAVKRAEGQRARQRAVGWEVMVGARGLMAFPALVKQRNAGGGWLSNVIKEVEAKGKGQGPSK